MAVRVFSLPALGDRAAEAELNGFLSSHRVLQVDRRLVEHGGAAYWTFCVDYLESPASGRESRGKTSRVDYQQVLSPEQFTRYLQLREMRKQLSQKESVPAYAIFTNEQLADIVRLAPLTKATLGKVNGLGEAKISRYGDRV